MEQQEWIDLIIRYGIYILLGIILFKFLKFILRKFKEEEARKGLSQQQAKFQKIAERERKRRTTRSPLEWPDSLEARMGETDRGSERGNDESLSLNDLQDILQEEAEPEKPARKSVADYIPAAVLQKVMLRDEGRCAICGSEKEINWYFILPPSQGGSPTEENVRLLCEACQASRQEEE